MPATSEIRELTKKRKRIGWIALALVALIVAAMYTLDRRATRSSD